MRSATTNTKKRFPQKALAAAITTIILGTSTTAMAFKPEIQTHGHTFITKSILSKEGMYYKRGSRVEGFTTKYSNGDSVGFSTEAIDDVVQGNVSNDSYLPDYLNSSSSYLGDAKIQISDSGVGDLFKFSLPL